MWSSRVILSRILSKVYTTSSFLIPIGKISCGGQQLPLHMNWAYRVVTKGLSSVFPDDICMMIVIWNGVTIRINVIIFVWVIHSILQRTLILSLSFSIIVRIKCHRRKLEKLWQPERNNRVFLLPRWMGNLMRGVTGLRPTGVVNWEETTNSTLPVSISVRHLNIVLTSILMQ